MSRWAGLLQWGRLGFGDGEAMMQNMMDGGMWGMGVGGVLLLILVVLIVAALVKYLFFR